MASNYTFYFTDTTKTPITLQAYTSNGPISPSNNGLIVNAVAQNTTLKLYGKGMQDYGEGIEQNLIYLLENFANNLAPINPIEGQIWYDNSSGGAELNIRTGSSSWASIILASGTAPMTGELILAGNPTDVLGATPKQYVDAHITDLTLHITPDQDTFLNGLNVPTLTATEVNYLIGVTSDIQTQINNITGVSSDYVLLAGSVMDTNADLTLDAGDLIMNTAGNITVNGGNVTLSTGTVSTAALTVTTGNAILNTGNLTVSAGGIAMFGDLTSTDGNISLSNGTLTSAGVIITGAGTLTLNTGDISLTSGSINLANDINFSAGEVLGLPATPSPTAATSKEYVDAEIGAFVAGDGKLTAVDFITGVTGSPLPDPNNTTLEFTLSLPGSPASSVLTVDGVSRSGHIHSAIDTTLDNTFNAAYGTDVQTGIEYVETIKANLASPTFTGTTTMAASVMDSISVTGNAVVSGTVSASLPTATEHLATKGYVDINTIQSEVIITRTLENITGSPEITLFATQTHLANDNLLYISINGQKQYNSTRGLQQITYDSNAISLTPDSYTGIDTTQNYDFNISIDGGAATTITISAGSFVTLHSQLITEINTALNTFSPQVPAQFGYDPALGEAFQTDISGNTSTVAITYAGAGNPYLFAVDGAPGTIIAATFQNDADTITIAGDVTATFTANKAFTIRGSVDSTYGSYDGTYRVHVDDAVFDSTNTIIPIAKISSFSDYDILLPTYIPGGSPDVLPAPSNFGSVHLTPIVGFDAIGTGVTGIDGDYVETDSLGDELPLSETSTHVSFVIPLASSSIIETLLHNIN